MEKRVCGEKKKTIYSIFILIGVLFVSRNPMLWPNTSSVLHLMYHCLFFVCKDSWPSVLCVKGFKAAKAIIEYAALSL